MAPACGSRSRPGLPGGPNRGSGRSACGRTRSSAIGAERDLVSRRHSEAYASRYNTFGTNG